MKIIRLIEHYTRDNCKLVCSHLAFFQTNLSWWGSGPTTVHCALSSGGNLLIFHDFWERQIAFCLFSKCRASQFSVHTGKTLARSSPSPQVPDQTLKRPPYFPAKTTSYPLPCLYGCHPMTRWSIGTHEGLLEQDGMVLLPSSSARLGPERTQTVSASVLR